MRLDSGRQYISGNGSFVVFELYSVDEEDDGSAAERRLAGGRLSAD